MALARLTLIRLAALATFSRNAGEGAGAPKNPCPDMPLGLVDALFPLIVALGLAMARMTGVVLVLPVFTRLGMTGILRSAVALALAIPAVPHMLDAFPAGCRRC